jgi:hypothetical protein
MATVLDNIRFGVHTARTNIFEVPASLTFQQLCYNRFTETD